MTADAGRFFAPDNPLLDSPATKACEDTSSSVNYLTLELDRARRIASAFGATGHDPRLINILGELDDSCRDLGDRLREVLDVVTGRGARHVARVVDDFPEHLDVAGIAHVLPASRSGGVRVGADGPDANSGPSAPGEAS